MTLEGGNGGSGDETIAKKRRQFSEDGERWLKKENGRHFSEEKRDTMSCRIVWHQPQWRHCVFEAPIIILSTLQIRLFGSCRSQTLRISGYKTAAGKTGGKWAESPSPCNGPATKIHQSLGRRLILKLWFTVDIPPTPPLISASTFSRNDDVCVIVEAKAIKNNARCNSVITDMHNGC